MFGKFGDLAKLAKMAMEQSKKLSQIEATGEAERGAVRVRINGKMEVVGVTVDEEYFARADHKSIAKAFLKAHKDAFKKIQKELRKQMDVNEIMGMLK